MRSLILCTGRNILGACATALCGLTGPTVYADTFGSGPNAFTIDFVTIGNPGNGDDAGEGGGLYFSAHGGVPYVYRMGVTEVSQDWITKATNLGLTNVTAGPWAGNQPAANVTWLEAAAFVNWLNTSQGHQAAYNLTFSGSWSMTLWAPADAWTLGGQNLYRHKNAYYFLPSEDEWYKAAYHQNDGATANYWDYATGSNSIPTAVASGTSAGTAVYNGAGSPAVVDDAGGLSAYGTRGQGGNVWELIESASDGLNSTSSENRVVRGGGWINGEDFLRSPVRVNGATSLSVLDVGFRVASVPEPSSTVLMIGSGLFFLARRRRERSL